MWYPVPVRSQCLCIRNKCQMWAYSHKVSQPQRTKISMGGGKGKNTFYLFLVWFFEDLRRFSGISATWKQEITTFWQNKRLLYRTYFVGLLHPPFWLQLVLALFGHYFSTFYTSCLAKDHWRGFSTRNAHMVHIVNLFR